MESNSVLQKASPLAVAVPRDYTGCNDQLCLQLRFRCEPPPRPVTSVSTRKHWTRKPGESPLGCGLGMGSSAGPLAAGGMHEEGRRAASSDIRPGLAQSGAWHLAVRSRTLNPAVQLSLPRAQARPMAATTKAAHHGQARPWCSYTIHMPKTTQVQ